MTNSRRYFLRSGTDRLDHCLMIEDGIKASWIYPNSDTIFDAGYLRHDALSGVGRYGETWEEVAYPPFECPYLGDPDLMMDVGL